ncbi:MAG: hypothetical protein H6667_25525 [Ardenticatenaceae bacterium]|nr:hypothetical protein [Ardenticatenaceae bacterium]
MIVHVNTNGRPKCGTQGHFIYLEKAGRKANCKRCLGQVRRRKNSNTVNRGWLKRRILEGKVLAKCDGVYTDDYAFDAAYNFQKTGWLKARIEDDNNRRVHNGQYLYFRSSDFRGYGYAWRRVNDEICLSFGYCSYTLRVA